MRRIPLFLFAACLLLGAGCSPSAPPAAAPEPVGTVRIANIGEYSVLNLVAREKGFFTEQGVIAQVDEYDSGATSIAALLSGNADVAVAADFVGVTRLFTNPEIRILAELSEHDVFRVIGRRDAGINMPADLKGKTVGVTRKTAGEYYLGRFLTFNGLFFGDVTMVDLPPQEMAARLEAGTLDAILIFDPHAYDVAQRLGDRVAVWSAQGRVRTRAMLYTVRSVAERRPDALERTVRALVRAERFVQENDAETRGILIRSRGYDPAYVDHMWPNFSHRVRLGQDTLLGLEEQARWSIAAGLTEQADVPNYLPAIHFDALQRAAPDAVTIIH